MTRLRPCDSGDLDALVAINNGGYPAVPLARPEDISALLAASSLALVAEDDEGTIQGFVIALDPGQKYDSENYAFFEQSFANHLYIDRVVLSAHCRGKGVGGELYQAVFERAKRDGRERVTCEVNLEPPNPGSLRFHRRWGFEDVGTQPTKGGEVVVQLLQAPVT